MSASSIAERWPLPMCAAIALALLGGCASLSEKQCRRGDWQGIGYRDGANGYTEFRVTDHQEACAKFNVIVDSQAYETARQRGVLQYCTVAGGLRAGRSGGSYNGVCAPEAEPAFLSAYRVGLEINRVEQRLDALRSEQHSIRYRLHELEDQRRKRADKDRERDRDSDRDNDRSDDRDRREYDSLVFRLRELEREEWRVDSDLRHLELEAFRLR